jgi:hypothetical protein
MPTDLARVKELFLAVVEMPATERDAHLEKACADDPELRQQVEALLKSHENSGELLPRSPAEMLRDSDATEPDGTAASGRVGEPSATTDERAPGEPGDLRFLTPSEKPGHLGRLGPYEVQTILGTGGFGIVLKGFDERLHRVVAIKVLAPSYAASGAARKRFIREARAAAAVKNEHVVGIHDVQEDAEPPYLVMEYIDGISLQEKIDRQGALDLKAILRVGVQIAEGLTAAHKQGLVHRDIKPANILLENGVERVKITDFGLARAVDDASLTQSGTVAGTPMFMSPEQAEGLPIDHRSDLFSLGTLLYAMCTGHPPFRASGTHAVLKRVIDASPRPIREINNEIPDWLCDVIAKLHAKKPEDRFQTAKEVAELLGRLLAHLQQPTTAPLPTFAALSRPTAPEDIPGDEVATFPEQLKARDIVDVSLALVLTPVVAGLFWVLPGLLLGWLASWAGLGWWSLAVGILGGTAVFFGLYHLLRLGAAQRALVSRRGIELVRDALRPTFIPWNRLKSIEEATRWEVVRRVWVWPGLPPRGSIRSTSALHQFRIEYDGGCYYFAPADPEGFHKAIIACRAQPDVAGEPSRVSDRRVSRLDEGTQETVARRRLA